MSLRAWWKKRTEHKFIEDATPGMWDLENSDIGRKPWIDALLRDYWGYLLVIAMMIYAIAGLLAK